MSEATYRLSLGLTLFTILFFDSKALVYTFLFLICLEGITNFRINYFITSLLSLKKPDFLNKQTISMSNFDVHRALRFLVGILILFSNIIFLESLWWVSWLVSILLIISGITDLYPLTQFISLIDFEALLKKDSYQKNKFLETGVATKAIGIILNFVILLSFSAVLWRLPYQKYQIQEAYNDQISQLKASLENYYYKHNGFFGLKKENLPIFTRYPNAYLQMSFLGSEKTLWGLGTHKAQQNDWTRESLNIDGKKYLLEISLPSIHKEYIKFRNSLFLLITLSLSLFSYFLMSVIHYYIGKPLNKMVQYTQKVSNGKPDDELHFNFNDEFIELANFINQTLDSLLEQKQMLKNEEDRHKQSEQLLNIAKEETIRANEAKTRFLANMSHEFRTPLNSVIGFSQVLQRDLRLTESQRNHIKTIHKSGNHLLQLINDTLDLSKIEVGKMSIQENPFSISDLLKDLREMFKLNSKEKGVDLKVMIQGFSATDYFIGDNLKLKQVLINLVGNAIKFSESGVVKLRVRKSSEDLFLFEVIDQGPGMERPQLRDVFEPFSQGRSGELEGGTGLGLSISKKYVEFLGGQLKVKSVPEKGSKFYFIIKLEKASVQTKNHSKRNSIDSNDKPINIKELNVHQEILEELIIAAEMHNITLLKKLCKQLSKMKPDDQTLAREIEKLLKDYDLTAIQLLLQRGSHAA